MADIKPKIIISTQPSESFAGIKNHFARSLARLINFPMIEVSEAKIDKKGEQFIIDSDSYDWLIFTSRNGVHYFLKKYLSLAGKEFSNNHAKIAVIGKKTGEELKKHDIAPDFQSLSETSAGLALRLSQEVISENDRILLVLGNLAADNIEQALCAKAVIQRINCYITSMPDSFDTGIAGQIKSDNYDMIIFTSSSGFVNFAAIMKSLSFDVRKIRAACIGKTTAATLTESGVEPVFVSKEHDVKSIIQNIIEHY